MLLSNVWTCLRENWTNYQFIFILPSLKDYLDLSSNNINKGEIDNEVDHERKNEIEDKNMENAKA